MVWNKEKKKQLAIAACVLLFGSTLLGIGLGILYWGEENGWLFDGFNWLQENAFWGRIIVAIIFIPTNFPFIVGYALLTLASGFLFGFWWGLLTVVVGNQLGILSVYIVVNLFLKKKTEKVIISFFLPHEFEYS